MRRILLLLSTMVLAMLLASGIALAATDVVVKKFTNSERIAILTSADVGAPVRAAKPYPSKITVSGFNQASIRDVNLKLRGFGHTFPDDVGVLLVGPQGQTALVMSDLGGSSDVSGTTTLTLDDEAANFLPDRAQITAGTFKPTQGTTTPGEDGELVPANFPSPAPSGPYGPSLSVFDGTDPKGTWKLFVLDDSAGDAGRFGAWTLLIKARVTV
jgi:subtilisin-like proprotein convertase family protein